METLQTTVENELQSKENNAIVLWAMDYKEANDEWEKIMNIKKPKPGAEQ